MFVADPLYGPSLLPSWLEDLVHSPEIQRLRGVRLINTSSPNLAALSDTRRYTHTLGVLRLALEVEGNLSASGWSQIDRQSLLAAVLAHDAGTPPFGHVFEYLLRAGHGWSHEAMVREVLFADYDPATIHHQILPGRELRLGRAMTSHGLNLETVASLVNGQGPLGTLLAGTVDVDNMDNVWRMASMLGLVPFSDGPLRLASLLGADCEGPIFETKAVPLLSAWADLRSRVYRVLAFESSNLKGQAMLTDCIVAALESGIMGRPEWWWTDDQLLYQFERHPATKQVAQRFSTGDLYSTVFLGWYDIPPASPDLRQPRLREKMKTILQDALGIPVSPYVFYDIGTFQKSLAIRLTGAPWTWPPTPVQPSASTIVGVYTPRATSTRAQRETAVAVLEESFGLFADTLQPIPDWKHAYGRDRIYGLGGQIQLDL